MKKTDPQTQDRKENLANQDPKISKVIDTTDEDFAKNQRNKYPGPPTTSELTEKSKRDSLGE